MLLNCLYMLKRPLSVQFDKRTNWSMWCWLYCKDMDVMITQTWQMCFWSWLLWLPDVDGNTWLLLVVLATGCYIHMTYPIMLLWLPIYIFTCLASTFINTNGRLIPKMVRSCVSLREPTCSSGDGIWLQFAVHICWPKLRYLFHMEVRSYPAAMKGWWTCFKWATSAPFSGISCKHKIRIIVSNRHNNVWKEGTLWSQTAGVACLVITFWTIRTHGSVRMCPFITNWGASTVFRRIGT